MPTDIEPEQIVDYGVEYGQIGISLLIVAFLGLVAYLVLRRTLNSMYENDIISESLRGVFSLITKWIIVILVILVSLQQIGVEMASVWATLSAFVVLIGVGFVAVWSVLSNVLCSMLLLVFRPFSIGDKIEILATTGGEGLRGKVVNLNLLYTFILEDTNNHNDNNYRAVVQVPNNAFFQNSIRRWSGTRTKSLEETMFEDDNKSVKQNAML